MRSLGSGLFLFLARAAAVMVQLRMVEHWFGPRYSGLNVLLNQVTYYVLMAEFGLAASALALLFEPVERGETMRTAELVAALRGDLRRLTALAAPVAALLTALYALRLRHQLPYGEAVGTLWLSGGTSFLTLATLPEQCYLNARGRIFEVNLVFGSGFLLKTAAGLALGRLTGSYLAMAAAFPAVALLEAAVLRARCRGELPVARPSGMLQARRQLRAKSKFVLLHRLGGLIYYQSDFLILSLAASLATVGVYARYQYLAAGLVGLFTSLANALTAKLARSQIGAGAATRARLYLLTTRAVLFGAVACAVLFAATAQDCAELLFSAPPAGGTLPYLLAVLLFLNLAKSGDDLWVNARGTFEAGAAYPLLEAALYIGLGLGLVRRYGVAGIVLAGIATNLLFSVGLRLGIVAGSVLECAPAAALRLRGAALGRAFLYACPLLLLLLPYRAGVLLSPAFHACAACLLATPLVLGVLLRLSQPFRAGWAAPPVSAHTAFEGLP